MGSEGMLGGVGLEQWVAAIGQTLGICVVEVPSLRICAVNEEYATLVGAPDCASLVGTSLGDGEGEGLAAPLAALSAATARSGEASGLHQLVVPGASPRCVQAECRPLRGPDGRLCAVLTSTRDVTEHQRATDDLRRRTSELNAIFSALPDLYFHIAADGTILDYRAGRAADLYAPPEQFLGRRMGEIIPAAVAAAVERGVQQALAGRCLSTVEYPLLIDGADRLFEARIVPFMEAEAIIVVRDMTERRRAEEQLEAAYQRVIEADEERKRFYREVIRAVTNDRLRLVDATEIPVAAPPALELLLDRPENYSRLRRELTQLSQDAGMSTEGASDLVLAAGEAATNAVKHASGGCCTVSVTADRVIVRVSDRGTGIRPEDLPGAVLLPGFSTRVSLGMGYTIMLRLVDRVWLATSHCGTVVQLEKWIHPEEQPDPQLAAAWERL
jgi:anti-sigma regulatory factor (Ser/Thr protein kinase)